MAEKLPSTEMVEFLSKIDRTAGLTLPERRKVRVALAFIVLIKLTLTHLIKQYWCRTQEIPSWMTDCGWWVF